MIDIKTTTICLYCCINLGFHKLLQGQTIEYIHRFNPIAVQQMNKYNIPASIILAQAILTSQSGTSSLARNNNNHFGIKCFSTNCRKGHCSTDPTNHRHKDFFRIYNNPLESWRAHSQMLSTAYAPLKKYDCRRFATGLQRMGYDTDPEYATKLIGIIDRYNLDRFDR